MFIKFFSASFVSALLFTTLVFPNSLMAQTESPRQQCRREYSVNRDVRGNADIPDKCETDAPPTGHLMPEEDPDPQRRFSGCQMTRTPSGVTCKRNTPNRNFDDHSTPK
jgi:hypothetical protein